jgi:NAD-dependent DNA ligase
MLCAVLGRSAVVDGQTDGGTRALAQVTHVFSEAERTPLVKLAADSDIPFLDSCQLAALIDPDYLQREVQRHEAEAREQQAREAAEAAAKKAAAAATLQPQTTKKKPRIKRTYSAPVEEEEEESQSGAGGVGVSGVPAVKMEPVEDDQDGAGNGNGKRKRDDDGGFVETVVKRVARVAKRRRKLDGEKEKETTPAIEVRCEQEENGDSSSNGESSEMPATPMHERRRRFEGKVFFLLGRFMRKQAEMMAFIKENGGEVAKSISRKVTHLLTAQGDDGTLAFKQARQRKLKIITEERLNEFMAEARGARKAMLSTPTPTPTLMTISNEQTSAHLLQVPTTPVASTAQRREQAQRVVLTPMPSSSIEPAVLFDASPSWYDITLTHARTHPHAT